MTRDRDADAVVATDPAQGFLGDGGAHGRQFPRAESIIGLLADAGRQMSFDVTGTSMEPLLTAGDRVTVQPLSRTRADMKRGDLITFLSGEGVVVHRLIGKCRRDGTTFYQQSGDNTGNRSWIREETVIGRVVSFDGRRGRADMDGLLWRWVNPTIGMSRAAWFAFETILRKVKSAAIGNGRGGALASPAKRTLMSVFFPLSCGGFRFLVAKFGRRRIHRGVR